MLSAFLEPALVDLFGLSLLPVLEVVLPVPLMDVLVQVEESALTLLEPLDEFTLVPLVFPRPRSSPSAWPRKHPRCGSNRARPPLRSRPECPPRIATRLLLELALLK